jgi:DNA-directed RNA polymerase delta subunit
VDFVKVIFQLSIPGAGFNIKNVKRDVKFTDKYTDKKFSTYLSFSMSDRKERIVTFFTGFLNDAKYFSNTWRYLLFRASFAVIGQQVATISHRVTSKEIIQLTKNAKEATKFGLHAAYLFLKRILFV